jgi:hypothetical protein
VIETVVQPHGFVAAAHVHPAQTESFAAEAGVLGLRSDERKPRSQPARSQRRGRDRPSVLERDARPASASARFDVHPISRSSGLTPHER